MTNIVGELDKAFGSGTQKVEIGSANVADGDTFDTDITPDAVLLEPTVADRIAAVESISGTTVTVGLYDMSTPGSPESASPAEDVKYVAIGS